MMIRPGAIRPFMRLSSVCLQARSVVSASAAASLYAMPPPENSGGQCPPASPAVQAQVAHAARSVAAAAAEIADATANLAQAMGGSTTPGGATVSAAADAAAHAADVAAQSAAHTMNHVNQQSKVATPGQQGEHMGHMGHMNGSSKPHLHQQPSVGSPIKEREFVDKVDPVAPKEVKEEAEYSAKSRPSGAVDSGSGYLGGS